MYRKLKWNAFTQQMASEQPLSVADTDIEIYFMNLCGLHLWDERLHAFYVMNLFPDPTSSHFLCALFVRSISVANVVIFISMYINCILWVFLLRFSATFNSFEMKNNIFEVLCRLQLLHCSTSLTIFCCSTFVSLISVVWC